MAITLPELLSRFDRHQRAGSGFLVRCPAHEDGEASLHLTERDGKVLLHCFAGCKTEDILNALGLTLTDLFNDTGQSERRTSATYPYVDENGTLLFEVLRYEPKDFNQRRPDGRGGWVWHLDCESNSKCKCNPKLPPVRRVIYRLLEVIKAKSVLVVEGEKDVETARKLRLVATCNPHGSGKWRPEYCAFLKGKRVVVIADADAPGVAHAREVARSLLGVAEPVRLIEALPQAKDLTEWIEKGATREKLLQIIRDTLELTPADSAKWATGTQAAGFTLTRLGDLLSKPDMPVDYVWDGSLVVGTVSVVAAKPKVGKSTLARNVCLAVAKGEDFLEKHTKQGECIYLALEEREEDIRNDFRAMGADGTEPIFIHAAAAPAEGIKALCNLIRERRPVMVVGDPLFRLARIKDEKAYAETYAALGPVIDTARETGTHVMLCHHAGKALKADAIDSPLGSTAIGGAVSTLVLLKRTESYRTIQTVQRIGQELPETVLGFDLDTRRLCLAGTRFEADRQERETAILAFLSEANQPQTQERIRREVKGESRVVRAALTALAQSGRVKKTGEGTKGKPFLYEFPNAGSQYIVQTSKPESQEPVETLMNTEGILVRGNPGKSTLVCNGSETPKTTFPPLGSPADTPGTQDVEVL